MASEEPRPFEVATQVEGRDGQYRATIAEGYGTATGPFGGYLATLALRAAAAGTTKARPTELTCHFHSAARPGPVTIAVAPLHETPRSQSLATTIAQDGSPILSALAWFSDVRDGIDHDASPAPAVPPPGMIRPLGDLHRNVAGFSWLEVRPIYEPSLRAAPGDGPPWGQSDLGWLVDDASPRLRAWVRLRPEATFADGTADAARTLVAIDWMIPFLAAARYAGRRVVLHSTISLSVALHACDAIGEWLYCEARTGFAQAGIAHGQAEVWSQDGRLLATGMEQLAQRVRL